MEVNEERAVHWIKHLRMVHFNLFLFSFVIFYLFESSSKQDLREFVIQSAREMTEGYSELHPQDHWLVDEAERQFTNWSDRFGWRVRDRKPFQPEERWYLPSRIAWNDVVGTPCSIELPPETQFEPTWYFPPPGEDREPYAGTQRAFISLSKTVPGLGGDNKSLKDITFGSFRDHWNQLHKLEHVVTSEGIKEVLVRVRAKEGENYSPEQQQRFDLYRYRSTSTEPSKVWLPIDGRTTPEIRQLSTFSSMHGSLPLKQDIATLAIKSGIVGEAWEGGKEISETEIEHAREKIHQQYLIWRTDRSLEFCEEGQGPIYLVDLFFLAPMQSLPIKPLRALSLEVSEIPLTGEFEKAFGELHSLVEKYSSATMREIEASTFDDEFDKSNPVKLSLPLVDVSVPRSLFVTIGAGIVLILFLYFAAHLHAYRKAPKSEDSLMAVPWVGNYDLNSGRLITIFTIVLIPMFVIGRLMIPRVSEAINSIGRISVLMAISMCFLIGLVIFNDLTLLQKEWRSGLAKALNGFAHFVIRIPARYSWNWGSRIYRGTFGRITNSTKERDSRIRQSQ